MKVKDNKRVFGFSQNTSMYFYFYLDDMFRSVDHHQAVFTEHRVRYMQCKYI